MRYRDNAPRLLVTACSVALLSLAGAATAQTYHSNSTGVNAGSNVTTATNTTGDAKDEARDAHQEVVQATNVIERMQREPALRALLRDAKGVFVVPTYGRAALGIGGRGGVGVLLVNHDSTWSDPAFYNFGGVSAGLQAGVEGGSFVLVLNNDRAVNSFTQKNNWSLNAGAGLTIVDWSAKAQGSTEKGDVTLWSDTKGLFGSLAVSVTDIKYDADQTAAYYGQQVAARDVVIGDKVDNAQADQLKQALATAASGAQPNTSTSSAAMPGTTTAGSSAYSSGTASGTSTSNAANGVSSRAYEGNSK
jgi:SH3 domain-containing YSC84-like protein 1